MKTNDDGTVLRFSEMVRKAEIDGEKKGTNEYAKKFSLEVLKCRDKNGNAFTAYICCTPEEKKEILAANLSGQKGISLTKFKESGNIVSIKKGHEIAQEEEDGVRDYYGYHFLRDKKMKENIATEVVSKNKESLLNNPKLKSLGINLTSNPEGFVR